MTDLAEQSKHVDHCMLQTVCLALFLGFILILNLLVAAAVFGTTKLSKCSLCMQIGNSCVGNIFAALSLVGNAIYYLHFGNLPLPSDPGIDHHFLLYLGAAMSMAVLLLNTHFRYKKIVSVKKNDCNSLQKFKLPHTNMTLTTLVPLWLSCICISAGACVVQSYVKKYQFLISACICAPALLVAIVWNIKLNWILRRIRENSPGETTRTIKRTTVIIYVTISVYVVFLILGGAANVCIALYVTSEYAATKFTWLFMVVYLMMFTVEAAVYLYKMPFARKAIKKGLSSAARTISGPTRTVLSPFTMRRHQVRMSKLTDVVASPPPQ